METTHHGSCVCKAIRFTARVDLAKAARCNCTMCTKLSIVGTITKPDAIELTAGEPAVYQTPIAKRYFCAGCGTHCFGRGTLAELGGEFASVNVNTLEDVDPNQLSLMHWDGRHDNWEAGPRPTPWPIFADRAA
jgi:hypothetical protein